MGAIFSLVFAALAVSVSAAPVNPFATPTMPDDEFYSSATHTESSVWHFTTHMPIPVSTSHTTSTPSASESTKGPCKSHKPPFSGPPHLSPFPPIWGTTPDSATSLPGHHHHTTSSHSYDATPSTQPWRDPFTSAEPTDPLSFPHSKPTLWHGPVTFSPMPTMSLQPSAPPRWTSDFGAPSSPWSLPHGPPPGWKPVTTTPTPVSSLPGHRRPPFTPHKSSEPPATTLPGHRRPPVPIHKSTDSLSATPTVPAFPSAPGIVIVSSMPTASHSPVAPRAYPVWEDADGVLHIAATSEEYVWEGLDGVVHAPPPSPAAVVAPQATAGEY